MFQHLQQCATPCEPLSSRNPGAQTDQLLFKVHHGHAARQEVITLGMGPEKPPRCAARLAVPRETPWRGGRLRRSTASRETSTGTLHTTLTDDSPCPALRCKPAALHAADAPAGLYLCWSLLGPVPTQGPGRRCSPCTRGAHRGRAGACGGWHTGGDCGCPPAKQLQPLVGRTAAALAAMTRLLPPERLSGLLLLLASLHDAHSGGLKDTGPCWSVPERCPSRSQLPRLH